MPGPEPTDEQAFALRRAAYVINTTDLQSDYPETAKRLSDVADELGAANACEGCGEEATHVDDEGVDLCEGCWLSAARADEGAAT